MKFNIDIKKFVITILALVVLFIPTYLAIGSYFANQQMPRTRDYSELVLKIPDGSTATFTKDNDPDGMLTVFGVLSTSGTAVSTLPSEYDGESFILGTFTRESGDVVSYKYYFSNNADNCYYTDPDGKVFQTAKSDVLKFYDTKYSLYLFDSAKVPVLTVAGGSTVAPVDMSWSYLVGGIYRQINDGAADNSNQTFDLSNDLDLAFDIKPSECTVKIYSATNANEPLFEGTPENLSGIKIERNDILTVKVTASWEKTDGCEYYGSADYTFCGKITAPAVFMLGESKIEQGTLVVLSGLNVTDISKITFTSEPAIGCTPIFFEDGEYVRALVPINADLSAGTYKFNISYGLTTQTLALSVTSKTFDKSYAYYEVSKSLIDTSYSASDIAEYRQLISEISAQNEATKYWNGNFLNYEDNGIKVALGFGKQLLMKYGDDFRHEGVDYMFALGAEAPAMNSGKVVYVGACDVLGKFVVIDHGWGLKSWYAHLSETSVTVGDTVNKGQTVGKVGNTGFIPSHRLHVMVTVAGIPVSPYPLQDFGLIYPTN